RLVLLDIASVLASVLLRVPLVLSALRARLLVSRLALGLSVAGVLAAGLPRIPGILPIVPSILPPLGSLGLRIARRDPGERDGESQHQNDHPNPNFSKHRPSSDQEYRHDQESQLANLRYSGLHGAETKVSSLCARVDVGRARQRAAVSLRPAC